LEFQFLGEITAQQTELLRSKLTVAPTQNLEDRDIAFLLFLKKNNDFRFFAKIVTSLVFTPDNG